MSEWTVENRWICDSCNSMNLGRHAVCQTCGHVKSIDAKEVLSGPTDSVVVDPELLKVAKGGADWVCLYCKGKVRNAEGKCQNCAAPKMDRTQKQFPLPPPPRRGDDLRRQLPKKTYRPPTLSTTSVIPPRIKPWGWTTLIVGLVVSLAIGLTAAWLFGTTERKATVEFTGWKYTAKLRQRTLMHSEGWGSQPDAFNVTCHSKYYGDENCNPYNCNAHQVSYECSCVSYECNCSQSCTDNGNGFSTCRNVCSTCQRCSTCYRTEYDTCYRRCPVYKQWCAYDWYDWPVVDTKVTRGTKPWETVWPPLEAGANQKLDRQEEYVVDFTDRKATWEHKPKTLEEFRYFQKGAVWRVKTNRAGSIWPLRAQ